MEAAILNCVCDREIKYKKELEKLKQDLDHERKEVIRLDVQLDNVQAAKDVRKYLIFPLLSPSPIWDVLTRRYTRWRWRMFVNKCSKRWRLSRAR